MVVWLDNIWSKSTIHISPICQRKLNLGNHFLCFEKKIVEQNKEMGKGLIMLIKDSKTSDILVILHQGRKIFQAYQFEQRGAPSIRKLR